MKTALRVGWQSLGWAAVLSPFAVLTFIGIQGLGFLDLLRCVFPLIVVCLVFMGVRGIREGTSQKAWDKACAKEDERNSQSAE